MSAIAFSAALAGAALGMASDEDPLTATYAPDAALISSSGPAAAVAGRTVTYTFAIGSVGRDDATAVGVTAQLFDDAVVEFASATQGACTSSVEAGVPSVYCDLGDIASGKNVLVTVIARPLHSGAFGCTAAVTAPGDDNGWNNAGETSTRVLARR